MPYILPSILSQTTAGKSSTPAPQTRGITTSYARTVVILGSLSDPNFDPLHACGWNAPFEGSPSPTQKHQEPAKHQFKQPASLSLRGGDIHPFPPGPEKSATPWPTPLPSPPPSPPPSNSPPTNVTTPPIDFTIPPPSSLPEQAFFIPSLQSALARGAETGDMSEVFQLCSIITNFYLVREKIAQGVWAALQQREHGASTHRRPPTHYGESHPSAPTSCNAELTDSTTALSNQPKWYKTSLGWRTPSGAALTARWTPSNEAHRVRHSDSEPPVLNPDVIGAVGQDARAIPSRALSASSRASTSTLSAVDTNSECGDSDDSDSAITYNSDNSLNTDTYSTAGNDGSFDDSDADNDVYIAASYGIASSVASSDTNDNDSPTNTASDSFISAPTKSSPTANDDYTVANSDNAFISPTSQIARTIYGPPTKRLRLAPPSSSTKSQAQDAQTAAEPASTPEPTFAVPVEAKRRIKTRLLRFLSAEERKATIEALGP